MKNNYLVLVLAISIHSISFSQISTTAFDKAVVETETLNKYYLNATNLFVTNVDSSEFYYLKYRNGLKETSPELCKQKDIEYYNSLGSAYLSIAFSEKNKQGYLEQGIKCHQLVLSIDSNNYKSNKNMMIAYYNQGVDHIIKGNYCKQQQIAENVDWNQSSTIPDIEKLLECVKPEEFEKYKISPCFRSALPFALKLYRMNPKDENVLIALQGIYLGLNDKKNFKLYCRKAKKLSQSK